jgi:hypothetical protein
MKIVFEKDEYVASTWGAAIAFEAGVPQEVGDDFGVLCLQHGGKEVKDEPKPVAPKKSPPKKKSK